MNFMVLSTCCAVMLSALLTGILGLLELSTTAYAIVRSTQNPIYQSARETILADVQSLMDHMRSREWCDGNCANTDDMINIVSWDQIIQTVGSLKDIVIQPFINTLWSNQRGQSEGRVSGRGLYGNVTFHPLSCCHTEDRSINGSPCLQEDGADTSEPADWPSFNRNIPELSSRRYLSAVLHTPDMNHTP